MWESTEPRCLATVIPVEIARLSLLFTTAQGVDLLSTVLGLQRGIQEGNPWLHNLSATGTIGIKALATVGVVLVVNRYIHPRRRGRILLLLSVLTVMAPIANVGQIVLGWA